MQIIPSVQEYKEEAFILTLRSFETIAKRVQIDVADESFDKNPTLKTERIIKLLASQNNSLEYEFHLMTKDPSSDLISLENSGVSIKLVFIHFDYLKNTSVKSRLPIGVVLSPNNDPDEALDFFSDAPAIQIMTIIPGRQGNPFINSQLGKISRLRKKGFNNLISLDGGIKESQAQEISDLEFKPDSVVVGSFLKQNPQSSYEKLNQILNPCE